MKRYFTLADSFHQAPTILPSFPLSLSFSFSLLPSPFHSLLKCRWLFFLPSFVVLPSVSPPFRFGSSGVLASFSAHRLPSARTAVQTQRPESIFSLHRRNWKVTTNIWPDALKARTVPWKNRRLFTIDYRRSIFCREIGHRLPYRTSFLVKYFSRETSTPPSLLLRIIRFGKRYAIFLTFFDLGAERCYEFLFWQWMQNTINHHVIN